MTINKLTEEQIALWRADAESVLESGYALSEGYAAAQAVFCLATELQEYRKELPGGLSELQEIKSGARVLSMRLGEALERNSRQAIELQQCRKAEAERKE